MDVTTQSEPQLTNRRSRNRILLPGLLAAVAASVLTTLIASWARVIGVDFQVPSPGPVIPLSAFPVSTFVLSAAGVAGAAVLRRLSRQPAGIFVPVALSLTALSLVPPVFAGSNAATTLALVLAHLAAAAIVIPVLTSRLRDARKG